MGFGLILVVFLLCDPSASWSKSVLVRLFRRSHKKVLTMQFDTTGLESYITDKEIESQEGIWLKFPNDRKIHVLRAGGGNSKYARYFNSAIKPYRRQMDRGLLDPEKSNEILVDVYVETVILGWSGIKDVNGNEIPYGKGVAREFFTAYPELFNDVVSFAGDAALFQNEQAKETADELGES